MKDLLKIFSQKKFGREKENTNMAFVCPICDVEYKTLPELARHNSVIHDPTSPTKPKPKVSMPPTQEEIDKAKEKLKQDQQQKEKVENSKQEAPVLQYQWIGVHDECGTPLDTIEVPVGEYVSVVCYCPTCRKQIIQRSVIPIGRQFSVSVNEQVGRDLRKIRKRLD